MRYTVANTAAVGKRVLVFVDGKQVDRCVECDTRRGYADYYPVDSRTGELKLNRHLDDFIVKRRYGKVTVEPLGD